MDIRFDGKTALVTGAGSGIGAAIARDLARAGARVVVADLHREAAEAVAAEIMAAGGVAFATAGDVSDPAVVEAHVALAVEKGGALHPAGRLDRPEEVSALTLFLLSEQASFITGSYHLVDGGYTAK